MAKTLDYNPKALELLGKQPEDLVPPAVSQADRTEAQALYTAIMTDTLIEENE